MGQITGRVFISLEGVRVTSKEGAKISPGGISWEAVVADTGIAGHQAKVEVPYIEATFVHSGADSLVKWRDFNGNVTAQTDTQKTYILRDARVEKETTLSKGEVQLRFTGVTMEEA